jgi:hypothetical protein
VLPAETIQETQKEKNWLFKSAKDHDGGLRRHNNQQKQQQRFKPAAGSVYINVCGLAGGGSGGVVVDSRDSIRHCTKHCTAGHCLEHVGEGTAGGNSSHFLWRFKPRIQAQCARASWSAAWKTKVLCHCQFPEPTSGSADLGGQLSQQRNILPGRGKDKSNRMKVKDYNITAAAIVYTFLVFCSQICDVQS